MIQEAGDVTGPTVELTLLGLVQTDDDQARNSVEWKPK